jgi:Tfp pilus assembly protein PilW
VRRRAAGAWRRLQGRLGNERGYTLVEVAVATVLSLIIFAGLLNLIVISARGQNSTTSRAQATLQTDVGLEALTRDLRQSVSTTVTATTSGSASAVLSLPVRNSQSLSASGFQGPSTQTVTWTCTGGAVGSPGTCTRQVSGSAAMPMISGVLTACFDPTTGQCASAVSATNPIFVYLTVSVQDTSQVNSSPVPGVSNSITVQDGVDLRDLST